MAQKSTEPQVEKHFERVSGCLDEDDANRLWHDLVKYRNATRQPFSYARRKYGRGFAIYKVTHVEVSGAA